MSVPPDVANQLETSKKIVRSVAPLWVTTSGGDSSIFLLRVEIAGEGERRSVPGALDRMLVPANPGLAARKAESPVESSSGL